MARANPTQLAYQAIRIEGGLIPADELARLTRLQTPAQTEQTETHYGTPRGLKLRDEIARYWKIAQNLWTDFQPLRRRADCNPYDTTLREFLVPLLRDVLGFTDLAPGATLDAAGHTFDIGHAARGGRLPLILAAHDQGLDEASERFGEGNPETGRVRRRSPFMLAQEALNACDQALWALVTNGLRLRILRDNPSLTRPAYVEVDLEAVFAEGLYADFTAFWLLAHASRFGPATSESDVGPNSAPADCPWERWRGAGQAAGVRAQERLRTGVAEALRALGTGFLSHPANTVLRNALQGHDGVAPLSPQAFFEELLRLVYRLIFLATVEDRTDTATGLPLIFAPGTAESVRERYLVGYSLTLLRARAVRRGAHDTHHDLWQGLSITCDGLARGEPALGLPPLGGLFDPDQCPHLAPADIENRRLLTAVFHLGYFREPTGLTRVNYRDMGPEELGSVYESLLELVPDPRNLAQPQVARLAFVGDPDEAAPAAAETGSVQASTKGNTRKLTGSYYTPDSLVQELIKSALEPVIAQTLKDHPERPVEALLALTICDPACGSGHFLLAAARRLADAVAKLRAPGGVPSQADYRHALRDVIGHCLFGVDKNPMAIQLAKTALWLEAYTPDLPLSFIDHHLQVGDALLGVLDPKCLENGIPDEAYTALSGDDKTVAAALKRQNKADLKSWKAITAGDLFAQTGLSTAALAVETLDDDTPEHLAAKRAAWQQAQGTAQRSVPARLADTYVAAFLAPKLPAGAATVPLSGYLWGLLADHPVNPGLEDAAQTLCRAHSVFHWWLAFPQVAASGGFSVMLGNPPWERIKLQEQEFFATRSPLVATARNKHERGQRIEWLREGMLLHQLDPDLEAIEGLSPPNRAEMALYDAFIAARRGAEAASLFAHSSGRFPLTGVGDVNTYALFAETFLQATTGQGRAGFIVPTGIATDDTTKHFFRSLVSAHRLDSLFSFYEVRRWFPATDDRKPFCLLTVGAAPAARFMYDIETWADVARPQKQYQLSPDDFARLNPNTGTLPIFRSERDSELTKKLYRSAPVLIAEAVTDTDGQVLKPEANPWGIRFQAMFHMSADSGLFHGVAESPGGPKRLPLYEAKMIHQFDHRWATYGDVDGKPGEVETADVTAAQKDDPAFTVHPRYWVDECEVLARIARVPSRVAKTWLGATPRTAGHPADKAQADLMLALASWVAGELFSRTAGEPEGADWTPQRALPHIAPIEAQLKSRFLPLWEALLSTGIDTKKAMLEFPKWATQCLDARLSDTELADLEIILHEPDFAVALRTLLDDWMDVRSPRWLIGWRDICRSTDFRTLISSVIPRAAVGDKFLLMLSGAPASSMAMLLGCLNSLTCDFIARQKVGGTSFKYFTMKQIAVLPPDRYTPADLDFIVPRVLELTYTAHDLRPWAEDLGYNGPPFPWNPERRAQLRAELDAWYARLYGLTRDELRYILDPADVMGPDYPSETFRVLKEAELRAYGEYRTRRLVLEAWDQLVSDEWADHRTLSHDGKRPFGDHGVIRNEAEAELAGLIWTLVAEYQEGLSITDIQSMIVHAATSGYAEIHLDAQDALRLDNLITGLGDLTSPSAVQSIRSFVYRLDSCGAVRGIRKGETLMYRQGASLLPPDVRTAPEHLELARLMLKLDTRRRLAQHEENEQGSATPETQRGRGAA